MSNSLDPDQDKHSVNLYLGKTVCNGYQQMTKMPLARKELKGTKITGERFLMLWAYIIFIVHVRIQRGGGHYEKSENYRVF